MGLFSCACSISPWETGGKRIINLRSNLGFYRTRPSLCLKIKDILLLKIIFTEQKRALGLWCSNYIACDLWRPPHTLDSLFLWVEMKSCLYLEPRRLKFEPSGRANWEFAGNTSPWLESSLESPDQNKHNNPVGQWTKVTLVNVVCSLHRIPLRRLIHGSSHWKGQKFKSSSSRKKKEITCPLRTLSFEVGLVLSSAGLYYQRSSLPLCPDVLGNCLLF